jgi:hypothetical protein
MFAGVVHHLLDLCSGHIARKNAADAAPLRVHFEHDLRGALTRQAKEFLQHLDHKLHRRKVVVMHHHLKHGWRLGFGGFGLGGGGAVSAGGHEVAGSNVSGNKLIPLYGQARTYFQVDMSRFGAPIRANGDLWAVTKLPQSVGVFTA